jgi:hypothetical protein
MIRITYIHPQRRGFHHHFRVVIVGAQGSRAGEEVSVFVNEEELYNYHRFQLASLTQLGRLCRFALEEEARTPHELQMLWNRELASAAWSGLGEDSPNAAGDAEALHEQSSRTDQLRLAGAATEDDEE